MNPIAKALLTLFFLIVVVCAQSVAGQNVGPVFRNAKIIGDDKWSSTADMPHEAIVAKTKLTEAIVPPGSKCDGVTDDSAAINAALAAGGEVIIPNAACRAANTITVPPGAELVGLVYSTQEPPMGSRIVCDLGVSPCVQETVSTGVGVSSSLGGQGIRNLTITRADGAIPAGTICLYEFGFKLHNDHVNCNGHAIGMMQASSGVYGITSYDDNLITCNITDSDLVQNGTAEWRVWGGRFGCNSTRGSHVYATTASSASGASTIAMASTSGLAAGMQVYDLTLNNTYFLAYIQSIAGNVVTLDRNIPAAMTIGKGDQVSFRSHNNFVKITGGNSGPNTLWISNDQFNDSANPTCFINWTGLTNLGASNEWNFNDNHLEFTGGRMVGHNVFCSDVSATSINRVKFKGNTIIDNNGNSTVWSLNPETAMGDWIIANNHWAGFGANGWNLSAHAYYLVNITGNTFNSPRVILQGNNDGISNTSQSSLVLSANNYAGGVTIQGNFGTVFPVFVGGVLGGYSVTNNATSPVEIDIPGYSVTDSSSSLTVAFNGAPATLSTKKAGWQLKGSEISFSFYFQISNLGAGDGNVTLGGLPFDVAFGASAAASSIFCTNMIGLGGSILASQNAGTRTVNFQSQGATGPVMLTKSNFTSSSTCYGSIGYRIR